VLSEIVPDEPPEEAPEVVIVTSPVIGSVYVTEDPSVYPLYDPEVVPLDDPVADVVGISISCTGCGALSFETDTEE